MQAVSPGASGKGKKVGAAVPLRFLLKGDLGHQVRGEGFQLDGDDHDAPGEVVVGDEVRHRDAEAHDGAVEGLGNAVGDHLGVAMRADVAEDPDKPRKRSEKAEEGGDPGRDFQEYQPGLQPRDLMTGPDLDRLDGLGPGPVPVLEDVEKDPGEDGRFRIDASPKRIGAFAGFHGPQGLKKSGRKDPVHAQDHGALENHGQGEDREDQQDGHEETALDEKLKEGGGFGHQEWEWVREHGAQ